MAILMKVVQTCELLDPFGETFGLDLDLELGLGLDNDQKYIEDP